MEHKKLIWPIWLGARPLTAAHSPMLCALQKVLQSCGALSICDPGAAGVKQSLIGLLWPKEWTTIATVSSMVVADDRARRESQKVLG